MKLVGESDFEIDQDTKQWFNGIVRTITFEKTKTFATGYLKRIYEGSVKAADPSGFGRSIYVYTFVNNFYKLFIGYFSSDYNHNETFYNHSSDQGTGIYI